jgi:hypothetical protein
MLLAHLEDLYWFNQFQISDIDWTTFPEWDTELNFKQGYTATIDNVLVGGAMTNGMINGKDILNKYHINIHYNDTSIENKLNKHTLFYNEVMVFHSQTISINGVDGGNECVIDVNIPRIRVKIFSRQKIAEERTHFTIVFTDETKENLEVDTISEGIILEEIEDKIMENNTITNLQQWIEDPDTKYEMKMTGYTSRHINEIDIPSIPEALQQFSAYLEDTTISHEDNLCFVIYLQEAPFFMDSTSLNDDIDVDSTPTEFFLVEKELFQSNKSWEPYYSENVVLPIVPENMDCEYIVNPVFIMDEPYTRHLCFRGKK